jgi:hypothetical protein
MDDLTRLIAMEDIRQLKARYFRLMDTRDFGSMRQVFSTDAVFDFSEAGGVYVGEQVLSVRGRDEVVDWIQDRIGQNTTVHHGHCHEITVDSDTEAHGVIAFEDLIQAPDRRTRLKHGAGHYHERYRFEAGAWRIAETKITRLFLSAMNQ